MLPGTMLNKNTSSGVGDTSPQMGSTCLTAPEHGTGDKHPGMGSMLELSETAAGALTVLHHGSRHQGKKENTCFPRSVSGHHPVIGYGRRKENTVN